MTEPMAHPTTGPATGPANDPHHGSESGPQQGYQPHPADVYRAAPRRLVRPSDDKMVGGVFSGFARYADLDPALVRVIGAIVMILGFPASLIGYLVAWAVMPEE